MAKLPLISLLGLVGIAAHAAEPADPAHNPIIRADVPDMAVSRVGKSYYMSSV